MEGHGSDLIPELTALQTILGRRPPGINANEAGSQSDVRAPAVSDTHATDVLRSREAITATCC